MDINNGQLLNNSKKYRGNRNVLFLEECLKYRGQKVMKNYKNRQ